MITAKELLAKGWKRRWIWENGKAIRQSYHHPKCWMKDVVDDEKIIIEHTLAQARWAQEHILDGEY